MASMGYGCYNRKTNIKTYIRRKLALLREQFYIHLTSEEIDHFYELKTESAVDQYTRDLLAEKL